MILDKIIRSGYETLNNTRSITRVGLGTLVKDPQVTVYAYLAVGFIWVTSPLVSRFVVDAWRSVEYTDAANHLVGPLDNVLATRLGLIAFPIFYTLFITSYFTCAVSASVLAKLDNRPTVFLYGLRVVAKRFFRVTKFSLLAFLFFPIGIIAQRHKLPRGIIGVLGSSLTLSMSQIAPAIVSRHENLFGTISHSLDTLDKTWRESLLIRLGSLSAFFILGFISFLPALVQHYWFDGDTARYAGWFLTVLLGVGSIVLTKVLSTVLTTTLYHQAAHK